MSAPIDPESYESLLEQGLDLQRRHDAVLASRTWRIQLALAKAMRSPGALVRLPAELWRALCATPPAPEPPVAELPAPPEPLSADKPLVLALLPWLEVGGAERVVLELIRGLHDELSFALLPAAARGGVDPAILEAAPWIFPPPADYGNRVAELLRNNPVRCVLISSCPEAYAVLPAIRTNFRGLVVDIVHNAAPEGSLGASVARDAHIDLHFAVGEHQAEALRSAGVAPKKIAVARNGIDCHGRFLPPERAPTENPLTLAWVGRLSEEKAPALFARTLAMLPGVHGLLIGDGPERFHVESFIRELCLSGRVRITGFTSRVAEQLSTCDALVLTSQVEGSPLTILEAMSLEKPVLAADVGGVSEAVEDGVTGLLVRERTPQAFAAAIRRLMDDPALRRELGAAGRRRVVERFSREQMLAAYRRGFQELGVLSKPAKP